MPNSIEISEGISGMWHYHISYSDETHRALCGVRTMQTGIPLNRWGKTPPNYHIPELWCGECGRRAGL